MRKYCLSSFQHRVTGDVEDIITRSRIVLLSSVIARVLFACFKWSYGPKATVSPPSDQGSQSPIECQRLCLRQMCCQIAEVCASMLLAFTEELDVDLRLRRSEWTCLPSLVASFCQASSLYLAEVSIDQQWRDMDFLNRSLIFKPSTCWNLNLPDASSSSGWASCQRRHTQYRDDTMLSLLTIYLTLLTGTRPCRETHHRSWAPSQTSHPPPPPPTAC